MAKDWTQWESTRCKGLLRFVLVGGVLGWGICVAIVWSLFMWMFTPLADLKYWFLRAIILFPLGGILWGLAVWYLTEYQYARHKKNTYI